MVSLAWKWLQTGGGLSQVAGGSVFTTVTGSSFKRLGWKEDSPGSQWAELPLCSGWFARWISWIGAIHGFGESLEEGCVQAQTSHTRPPSTKAIHQRTKHQRPVSEICTAVCTPEIYTRQRLQSVQTPFSQPVSAFAASNSLNANSFTCLFYPLSHHFLGVSAFAFCSLWFTQRY